MPQDKYSCSSVKVFHSQKSTDFGTHQSSSNSAFVSLKILPNSN